MSIQTAIQKGSQFLTCNAPILVNLERKGFAIAPGSSYAIPERLHQPFCQLKRSFFAIPPQIGANMSRSSGHVVLGKRVYASLQNDSKFCNDFVKELTLFTIRNLPDYEQDRPRIVSLTFLRHHMQNLPLGQVHAPKSSWELCALQKDTPYFAAYNIHQNFDIGLDGHIKITDSQKKEVVEKAAFTQTLDSYFLKNTQFLHGVATPTNYEGVFRDVIMVKPYSYELSQWLIENS